METHFPTDCGHAPRIGIVGHFITNWAKGNIDAVAEQLTDDATWTVAGEETYSGTSEMDRVFPRTAPELLSVTSIITHGRLASCDGFLKNGSARMHFSHVFRFASTSKAAKIKDARSYYIETLTR
ncbi:nuclear transport factor 2 family protein [Nesterenkonia muleiensis]|uniref:nuclear transport factor 2 family protein n=1 Tax=Nesterenkonia muleiensis TaxID=2282648 RepID=UPI000E740E72|nr:nuclear transport factor 2 family protein [Nesterenkonia muleiensis]